MSEGSGSRAWMLVAGAVVLGVALVTAGRGGPTRDHTVEISIWKGEDPGCPNDLEAEHVAHGIAGVTTWLQANQSPQGTFVDARDPTTGAPDEHLDLVRQATALWALARANASSPSPELRAAVVRGLETWRVASDPAGVPRAPGSDRAAATGLAILALAATETLTDPGLADLDRQRVGPWRDQLLARLDDVRTPNDRVPDELLADGTPRGEPSASADGAALAAWVRAARTDRPDLAGAVLPLVRATWTHDVERPRKKRRDPPATQELFPWAPLALRDLADSGWLDTEDAGPDLVELAVWMIDDHQTLRRAGNTAYAASAIASAAGWARSAEDPRQAKLQCVTDRMLARLLSWQVGHPLAADAAAAVPPSPQLTGGVVTSATDARVRVDYAAHLLVALLEWEDAR